LELLSWSITTIFVVPLALGLLLGYVSQTARVDRWLGTIGFSYVQRLPSAWEYVVGLNEGFYVRVHLKDRSRPIGGIYGVNSFVADEKDPVDIYLEELWVMDDNGNFVSPVPTTRGAWIPRGSATYIEFLSGEDSDNEGDTVGTSSPS
jgi:hypothetical protein